MLTIDEITIGYGDVTVFERLSLKVDEGQIAAVIGANGAGKTTLLRAISGLLRTTTGAITFENRRVDALSPERIVDLGISHVPQGRRIFPGLTVHENLRVARTPSRARRGPSFQEQLVEVHDLFPRLKERRDQLGWSLSGGEQQMLAVARALIARPRLILLDEPSLGLAPMLVVELFDGIQEISRREFVTILLVEQNVHQALRISDYVHILEVGGIVKAGTPAALAGDPEVERAYLGA